MPLTDRQKKELNTAILEYLRDNGYEETLSVFAKESSADLPEKNMKTLERKWTAVIRLTSKLQSMEEKLISTENELKETKPFNYNSFAGPKKLFDALLPNREKHSMKGHTKAINTVLFHPNYSWLVTCGDDARVGVWDYESGKLERWLRGHTKAVCDSCFNTNGTLLATSSVDMSIKVWNFEDEFRCIKTLNGHDHTVTGVCFMKRDDNLLMSCSRDGTVKIWEVEAGFCEKTLEDTHDGEWVKKIVISYDGSMFATCSVDQTLRVFNINEKYNELQVFRGHSHVVEQIEFSNPNSDGVILSHNKMKNYEMKNDDDSDGGDGNENNKHLPPRFIASASRDKTIIVWDIKSGDQIMTLVGHENWVRSLIFHPCGRFLISSADDKSIRCWDLSKRRLYSKIDDSHTGFVSCIDWHPSQSLLASVSTMKDVKIWYHDKKYHEQDEDF